MRARQASSSSQHAKEFILSRLQQTLLLLLAVSLTACSPHYQALKVDEQTGMYPAFTEVDPGGTLAFDTSVDPQTSPYVLLLTNATFRPPVFSFTVRNALAQSGITRVFTPEEFKQLAQDKGFTFSSDKNILEELSRFSSEVGPVLVVAMSYRFIGEARARSTLVVGDAQTGKILLRVDHHKTVWSNADAEALYPVLNQLRKWIKESSRGGA
jgi:hypothetical protein